MAEHLQRGELSSTRRVLEVAHQYAQSGRIYQAADRYLRLAQEYPRTREGQEAIRRILAIARQHEAGGRRYLALSLYDRVAALPIGEESDSEEQLYGSQEVVGQASSLSTMGRQDARPTKIDKAIEVVVSRYTKGLMHGVPFIDLTEEIHSKRNFERLGEVKRARADIHLAVDSLKRLKRGGYDPL